MFLFGPNFATLDSCSKIDFCQELPLGGAIYGSDCMVVCNDWHSALVPMLIHAEKTTTGACPEATSVTGSNYDDLTVLTRASW